MPLQDQSVRNTLCHRISEETGIRADKTILQAHAVAQLTLAVKDFSKDNTDDLYADRYDKYQCKLLESIVIAVDHKGFYDIAGQDKVNDQIIYIFLSGRAYDLKFFDDRANYDEKQHGKL